MKYPFAESTTLEFKEKIPEKNQIVKTVIGFCNGFGGQIIIGVKDNREVLGISETEIEGLIDTLHESIFKSCTPTILPLIHAQRFGDKVVLVIEVSPGMSKPYFITSEGVAKGTYIRMGSLTLNATIDIIEALKWQARGFSADELPIYRANLVDLDEEQFFIFLKKRRLNYKDDEAKNLLKHYKLILDEQGRSYPTLAGLLLFGQEAQHYFSEAFIICTHFKGCSGRDIIATRDCSGTLFQQAEESLNFILSRLNRSFNIQTIKRNEQLEIPEIALREVLINAIVHRDYQLPGPIKVAIYDDRVEIFSPGNFPGPLQVDQLEMGITYVRNTIICKIFREAGYVEKLGSGFLTLFDSYRQYRLPMPRVYEGSGFVKCVLPRPVPHAQFRVEEDPWTKMLDLFYAKNQITTQDIIKTFSVSRQTAVRLLNGFMEEGLIERRGKGPATVYLKSHFK